MVKEKEIRSKLNGCWMTVDWIKKWVVSTKEICWDGLIKENEKRLNCKTNIWQNSAQVKMKEKSEYVIDEWSWWAVQDDRGEIFKEQKAMSLRCSCYILIQCYIFRIGISISKYSQILKILILSMVAVWRDCEDQHI